MAIDKNPYFNILSRNNHPNNYLVDYLVEGMIESKGYGVIIGNSGVGKTQLAIRIAACIATNQSIANFDYKKCIVSDESEHYLTGLPSERASTIYFAGEDQENIINRIKAAESTLAKDIVERLPNGELPIIAVAGGPHRLKAAEQLDAFYQCIHNKCINSTHSNFPIKLLIFDTLPACFEISDENNNSEMQKVVSALMQFSERFNCAIIVIAHPPKSKQGLDGYSRGASTLINSAKFVWELKKQKGFNRILTINKVKNGITENAQAYFEITQANDCPVFLPKLINDFGQEKEIIIKDKKPRKYEQFILNILTNIFPDGAAKSQIKQELIELNKRELIRPGGQIDERSIAKRLKTALNHLTESSELIFTKEEYSEGIYKLRKDKISDST